MSDTNTSGIDHRSARIARDPFCAHDSSTGIDQTDDTPDKVWRCDSCGWLHVYVPIGDGTFDPLAPERAAEYRKVFAQTTDVLWASVPDQIKGHIDQYRQLRRCDASLRQLRAEFADAVTMCSATYGLENEQVARWLRVLAETDPDRSDTQ